MTHTCTATSTLIGLTAWRSSPLSTLQTSSSTFPKPPVVTALDVSTPSALLLSFLLFPLSSPFYPFSHIIAYGLLKGQRYFYFNILEELDVAGEYYIDRAAGMIYFWPPSSIGPNARTFVSVITSDMVTLNNAKNVTFTGISLFFSLLFLFFSTQVFIYRFF